MPLASALLAGALVMAPPSPAPAPWVAPVAGPLAVARPFDPPSDPWGAGHRGVDLRTEPGASVRAAGAGRVSFAGVVAGRGVVVVSHGTLRTTYEPVDTVVRPGTVVAPGDVIGRLSAVGGHCAPAACLHWGLLEGSDYLDPMSLLRGRRVRLLPLRPSDGVGGIAAGSSAVTLRATTAAGDGRAPPLMTTMGAATTGLAGAAALWWRRRGPP